MKSSSWCHGNTSKKSLASAFLGHGQLAVRGRGGPGLVWISQATLERIDAIVTDSGSTVPYSKGATAKRLAENTTKPTS